ncbi:patatin-like phospholipase family protein [Myroides sp. LJL116]
MKNKSIGLALSGGGHKGLAHAGVLKFFEELQIKPEVISGTSAGAMIGCLYSIGMPSQEILSFFQSINIFNWSHFTFSKPGLMDAYAFEKYLYHIFKNKTLSDLPIPTYITATDINKGTLHIFEPQTKITQAILASCAFPGIFSPINIGQNLYSDGGILNNFPTDIIKHDCDYLIGVNACPFQKELTKELKNIKEVTLRAFELMSRANYDQQAVLCNWLIEPQELSNFTTFETSKLKMEQIYELGYTHTKESYLTNKDKLLKAIS